MSEFKANWKDETDLDERFAVSSVAMMQSMEWPISAVHVFTDCVPQNKPILQIPDENV